MFCECPLCGKELSTYSALASHVKWKHGPRRRHECPVCFTEFRDSFGVKRHYESVHSSSHVEKTSTCPLCDVSASKKSLKFHFSRVHNIKLVEETLVFNTFEEFYDWKTSMELDTHSKFVKHRASKTHKDGTVISYFYCFRDGQFKSHSKGLRAARKLGSIKMNAYCPALLKTQEKSGIVTVLFRKTHFGHTDAGNNTDIDDKNDVFKDQVASDDILDDVHGDCHNNTKDETQTIDVECDMLNDVHSDCHNSANHEVQTVVVEDNCPMQSTSDAIKGALICPLCGISGTKKALETHFTSFHHIKLEPEFLVFANFDEFFSWKLNMEAETRSKFVEHRGSKTLKDNTVCSHYYCFQDGQCKSIGGGLKIGNKCRSVKLNAYCPAFLKIEETNDSVTVLFMKTHVGHNDTVNTDGTTIEDFCEDEEDAENELDGQLQVGYPNDEIVTVVDIAGCPMETSSDVNENCTIVIEVPSVSSEDRLMKKKQEELQKLVDILDSIKTDEGLEAFRLHVAPLESIVQAAEKKWSSVVTVQHLESDALVETEKSENISHTEKGINALSVIGSYSLTEPIYTFERVVDGEMQNYTD